MKLLKYAQKKENDCKEQRKTFKVLEFVFTWHTCDCYMKVMLLFFPKVTINRYLSCLTRNLNCNHGGKKLYQK